MDKILYSVLIIFMVYSGIPNIHFRFFSKRVHKRLPRNGKHIALTFDDGPDPRYTPRFLDLLKKYGIKCTFFVLGEQAKANPELIRRMTAEGHQVGLHANSHKDAMFMTYGMLKKDFESSLSALQDMGIRVRFYRPPWGLVNVTSNSFIRKYQFEPFLWSIHAMDWSRNTDVKHIIDVLTQKVRPGDIILLHDGRGAGEAPLRTLAALETALPVLLSQGYEFVIPGAMQSKHS